MPEGVKQSMKFVVAQTGARRGYAIPAILSRAGMLERFYTDVCGNVGWGEWLTRFSGLPLIGSKLKRLANRHVPDDVTDCTRTFALPNLRWMLRSVLTGKDPTEAFRIDTLRTLELGESAIREGFGEATHLYTMLSEFSPIMVEAKKRGITVVAEVYILLSTERLLAKERLEFPDWEPAPPDWDLVRHELMPEDVLMTKVDQYICPSEAVRDDLINNWGVRPDKTTIVPYGMNPEWLKLEPTPQRGRVLFVGTADLRKGIHYLAMAANELRKRGHNYEFRVAGHVTDSVLNQPLCKELTFLGRVPRDRIQEEFRLADLFVLPSLAEGSAEVTYESMAAGVPMVTTAAAGSVARDGVEALIVPERDPLAVANAIEKLIEDRSLRQRMAFAARERARNYTWEFYGKRLLDALQSLPL